YQGQRNSVCLLRRRLITHARLTSASLAALSWLHAHSGKNDLIVNDINADGSLWMYAFRRLHPLFAIKPIFSDRASVGDWTDRLYLLDHLDKLGNNSRADTFATTYRAR